MWSRLGAALLSALPLFAQGTSTSETPAKSAPDIAALDDGEKQIDVTTLTERVTWLAADERKGRMTGSEEADATATYISEHFQKCGLKPSGTGSGWLHKFPVPGRVGTNVCGLLPGTDPALKAQIMVIGAHYDHVGIGAFGSRTPARKGEIHNGADDNASGTGGMLELVEAFTKAPPKRSILFLAFSGEEMGLIGSREWVKKPTVPLERVVAMMNLDMIGRSRDRYVFVGGLNTAETWLDRFREVAKPFEMDLELNGGGRGPSDHASFYDAGIPALFFFTAEHGEYHTPDDDTERLNLAGETEILRVAYRMAKSIANGPKPKFKKDDRDAMPDSSERRVDQGQFLLGIRVEPNSQGTGVVASQVGKGKAGYKAGLLEKDVITKIDATSVGSPRAFQLALAVVRPGSNIVIEIQRGGKTLKLKATTRD